MLKLCGFEFKNKIVASINGDRRQTFNKGDRVVVLDKDKLTLMRLGAKLISERDVNFDDIFTAFESTEADNSDKENTINTLTQEKEALQIQVDELNLKVEELEESLKNTQETETPKSDETNEEEVKVDEVETTTDEVEEVTMNKTQIIEELTRLGVKFNKNDLKEVLAKLLQDTLNAVDETETPKSE